MNECCFFVALFCDKNPSTKHIFRQQFEENHHIHIHDVIFYLVSIFVKILYFWKQHLFLIGHQFLILLRSNLLLQIFIIYRYSFSISLFFTNEFIFIVSSDNNRLFVFIEFTIFNLIFGSDIKFLWANDALSFDNHEHSLWYFTFSENIITKTVFLLDDTVC